MNGVFINYRTGDGEKAAEQIDEKLLPVFGRKRVFRDQRELEPGVEYEKKLWDRLHKSSVFLALVGPGWLTARDEAGRLKLHDEDDFVRREIAVALRQTATQVIPVLLGAGVAPPKPVQLPADIRELAGRQVMFLRPALGHIDLPLIVAEVRKYLPARKDKKERDAAARARGTYDGGRGNDSSVTVTGNTGAVGVSYGDNPGPVINFTDQQRGRRR